MGYTLHGKTGTNHSFTDSRDAASIADDADIVLQRDLNLNDTFYTLHGDVIFQEHNEMLINLTFWTSQKSYWVESQKYIISNEFESSLTSLLEESYTYEGLDIVDFESVIILSYNGEDTGFSFNDWLDFANYTPFQWIV